MKEVKIRSSAEAAQIRQRRSNKIKDVQLVNMGKTIQKLQRKLVKVEDKQKSYEKQLKKLKENQ